MAMSDGDAQPVGVVVLGSTGSIGTSTLDVIAAFPERFRVVGLAAGGNQSLLEEQIRRFAPDIVAIRDDLRIDACVPVMRGAAALNDLAVHPSARIIVIATTGHTAIEPAIAALRGGKIVALANKETIVAGGELVMAAARAGSGELRPVDSEHSAIWQCVGAVGRRPVGLRRLILTASGGPFLGRTSGDLASVTPEQALRHPTWSMGAKVTIDSSTLMNKGLELIEASWLFDVPVDDVDIVIHPQSVVHSLVEFDDGALIGQIGSHDMRLPIQYALTWPERLPGPSQRLSLRDMARLEFLEPDLETFPLISVAREAARAGRTYPTVLSTADEVVVEAFLTRRVRFTDIATIVCRVVERHRPSAGSLSLDAISEADAWARRTTESEIRRATS
jgi:1-deoxy-D-xylulose-5-phosphate reductoisomerase